MNELKNMWSMMDEKLKKQEILNKNLVKEILQTKGNKSLSKLVRYEIFNFIVCLLLIPFFIYIIKIYPVQIITWYVAIYFASIVSSLYCLWGLFKMYGLLKIDFNKDIGRNINNICRYDIQMKYEKMAMWFIIPIITLLYFTFFIQENVSVELFILVTVIIVIAIFLSIWSLTKIYPKLISSVKESLERVNELEEE